MLLTSCGAKSGYFRLEGKFLHMNQGEFYVYSPDGSIDGIDTIKVEGGRFTYETPCEKDFTLMIVFPNFSEQPIFAESGKSVDIQADASHLKELTVKGTKANELMNKFREMILNVAPPEEKRLAEQFVKNHPESPVCVYLIRKYFISDPTPNYKKAYELLEAIKPQQPDNNAISKLLQVIKPLKNIDTGTTLPAFTAYDINGHLISSTTLASAPVAVITTWSSDHFDSMDMQRELKRRSRQAQGKLKLMSICVDANKKDCERTMRRDSISWPNVCNGDMFEDKTLKKLGLTALPDNIVLKNGRIIARGLKKQDLYRKLDDLTK